MAATHASPVCGVGSFHIFAEGVAHYRAKVESLKYDLAWQSAPVILKDLRPGLWLAIPIPQAATTAGADVAFIGGVKTKELLEKTVKALAPTPVLVNVISGGLTPSFTTKEAEQMGAKIIIFSLVSCVAMVHAVQEAMALLKKTGTDHTSARGMDPRAFLELIGLDEVVEVNRRAGGTALSSI
ncbi:hypothetical protein BDV93DRAFT_556763 [Ceratobasidium sp. AG-I]|nr:hypothetical protein BDV93DRAFT_556763 [Ceratobasidium sp. AG-I]